MEELFEKSLNLQVTCIGCPNKDYTNLSKSNSHLKQEK